MKKTIIQNARRNAADMEAVEAAIEAALSPCSAPKEVEGASLALRLIGDGRETAEKWLRPYEGAEGLIYEVWCARHHTVRMLGGR